MSEIPDYLEAVVEEAINYYEDSDVTVSEAAVKVATYQPHITSHHGDRDVVDVIGDLRDCDALCTDELDTYRNYGASADRDESTLEGIAIRSLEELLHDELRARTVEV